MSLGFQNLNPDGVSVRSMDGRNFILQEDVIFNSKDGNTYKLPIGARSDGASTPPVIWINFPPFGSYWLAAFLHDCAYRNTLEVLNGTSYVRASLPKNICDNLILEAMTCLGTHAFTRQTIYDALVVAGGSSFEADRLVSPTP